MAYLLILNGSRVDEVVELSPEATLTIGSSDDAYIQLAESDVAPVHVQVYPGEGSYWLQDLGQGHTYVNADPLSKATHGLQENDVLILGRTFIKFLEELPVSFAAVEPADDELEALRAEAERSAENIQRLEKRREEAAVELTKARKATKASQRDAKELSAKNKEIRRALEQTREQLQELKNVRAELQALRADASAHDMASTLSVLEAMRGTLESLGVPQTARDLPRGEAHDAGALLDVAGLTPEVKQRVEASLVDYVDRESLRRFSGSAPVFERTEESQAIEKEMRTLRARAADRAAAFAMGRSSVTGES